MKLLLALALESGDDPDTRIVVYHADGSSEVLTYEYPSITIAVQANASIRIDPDRQRTPHHD